MVEFLANYGLIILFFCLGYGLHAFVRDICGKRDGKLYFHKSNIDMLMIFESLPSEMRKKERLKIEVEVIDDEKFDMLKGKYNEEDYKNARISS